MSKICRYRQMLLRYLYTISKLLCFDIRFSCSLISVFFCWIQPGLPTRYWTQIAVCTLHCESIITRGSCAARAALSRRSGGCTRRRGSTRCTGRSTRRSPPPSASILMAARRERAPRGGAGRAAAEACPYSPVQHWLKTFGPP